LTIFEKKKKREFRRKQRAFFKQMEAILLESLARGEVMPGIARENVAKAGPPKEPIVITARNSKVRTISCMNEELLAELQRRDGDDSDIPFPAANISSGNLVKGDGRSHGRPAASGPPPSSLEGRPPLPHRRLALAASPPREPKCLSSVSTELDCIKHDSMDLSPEQIDFKTDINAVSHSIDNDLLEGEHLLDEPPLAETDNKIIDTDTGTAKQIDLKSSTEIARPSAVKAHNRRNTGGTIFVKSTMENPDIDATIRCICGIYRVHIVESTSRQRETEPQDVPPYQQRVDVDIFRHYGDRSKAHVSNRHLPSLADIESFFKRFYEKSMVSKTRCK
jgi:hypothetical protein